ncbi:MAG: TonB-dependent receptor plug domain-containing protein [Flavobacteriales bacterium]|nr:TonB-dependent receptor plug domain-containing protein [Flavobacteriales bacterium]
MKTQLFTVALCLCALQMRAQSISGTVYSAADSSAIPGVNVSVKGTYSGTFTDSEGKFNLRYGKSDSLTLLLSFIGYDDKEINTASGTNELQSIYLKPTSYQKDEAVVLSTRASHNTATAYTDVDEKTIKERNYGRDIPYVLQLEPSVVTTSDAGAGVGYTGIRIRGTDPTRINVTLNGVPVNDSESHGTYWVDFPDLASSLSNIQVQRGVGTSSNGGSAFGASLNMQTGTLHKKWYVDIINGYGSFNTWRHTIAGGSGLIANKFTIDARLSRISSDGYVDRGSSSLWSLYASAAYHGKKTLIRFNVLSGLEKTYQAWYGTPEARITGDIGQLNAYIERNDLSHAEADNLRNSDRRYNYYTYKNQIDHYRQDHYQLILSHEFNQQWNFNLTGHYTRGYGYYEEQKLGENLSDYGLPFVIQGNDTTKTSDIIRRRWLDNHFYGATFSLNYNSGKRFSATFGGGFNQYLGKHYGEVVGTDSDAYESIHHRYYENNARKNDINIYVKATYFVHPKVSLFADLQHRTIEYSFYGPFASIFGDVSMQQQLLNWHFFNPKFGINYEMNSRNRFYTSIAMANREPARTDLVESTQLTRPKHETLYDWELGYQRRSRTYSVGINAFWMIYHNQLVLTGAINDVGSYTHQNVDWSDRYGLELTANWNIIKNLNISGNFTWSQNKIWDFTEYVDDYDNGGQVAIHHGTTDIAFSPNYIAAGNLTYEPIKKLRASFITKYVGKQFLDNTSNSDRMLKGYVVNNVQVSYSISWKFFKEIGLGLQLNNIFNQLYSSNGYTFSYIYGGQTTTENFYYPQAGFNFMTMLTLKF